MSDEHSFVALDLGAESGRAIVVTLADGTVRMRELHRWANRPVQMCGTLYWDFPYLFAEVVESLRICADEGIEPDGISVDTWGVNYGLLDPNGKLLSNPVHYRDGRTEGIHDYTDPIMTRDEIFALTAYEPWPIASLFQLASLRRDGSPLLDVAETFLNMPDLFHYFLTGVARSEMSIANTSNLMSVDCTWCEPIIERFKLPRKLFDDLVEPCTVLGPLSAELQGLTGLGEVPVIATCGHDTSAAVAAVPGEGDNWAFLSSGTWSILGTQVDAPIATARCLELGFTNEYTVGGWYLARNISGLWLIQELRRKWDGSDDPWDYERMTTEAADAARAPLVNAADGSLLAPEDMEQALHDLIVASGQNPPSGRGELIRGVLESLALEYNHRLDTLAELTGRRAEAIYLVGGGIKNTLLCQLTADACGVPVHAGADQCTALGNGLAQALALGLLDGPADIRRVMRESSAMTTYEPTDASVWAEKRTRYTALQGA
ncbi:MAG: rhamnulokinase [Phycisphaerae bacterium]|nr:rhamnulokinase [Phycisphaerae bacterium]